jgi:hypothetical protein
VNESVLDVACPANAAGGYRGLFAENVIAFWARPLGANGAVLFNVGSDGFDSNTASGGNSAPALPASVEISFIVIDSRTANRLASSANVADLVGTLQLLAGNAGKVGSGDTPAAAFLDALNQQADLRFLVKGASPCQILVDLN